MVEVVVSCVAGQLQAGGDDAFGLTDESAETAR
jgi:hypothetical protein